MRLDKKHLTENTWKKPLGQKIVDAFDRSGLGGIYSDINNHRKIS